MASLQHTIGIGPWLHTTRPCSGNAAKFCFCLNANAKSRFSHNAAQLITFTHAAVFPLMNFYIATVCTREMRWLARSQIYKRHDCST